MSAVWLGTSKTNDDTIISVRISVNISNNSSLEECFAFFGGSIINKFRMLQNTAKVRIPASQLIPQSFK